MPIPPIDPYTGTVYGILAPTDPDPTPEPEPNVNDLYPEGTYFFIPTVRVRRSLVSGSSGGTLFTYLPMGAIVLPTQDLISGGTSNTIIQIPIAIAGSFVTPEITASGSVEVSDPITAVSGNPSIASLVLSGAIDVTGVGTASVSGVLALPEFTLSSAINVTGVGSSSITGNLAIDAFTLSGTAGAASSVTGGLAINPFTLSGSINSASSTSITGAIAANAPILSGTIGLLHPDAINWRDRIVAAGGTVSDAIVGKVSAYLNGLDSNSLRSKIREVYFLCQVNSLSNTLQKVVYTASGGATLTNVGFVSGDYDTTQGIRGKSSSRLRTNYVPSTQVTQAATGMSAWIDNVASGGDQLIAGARSSFPRQNEFWQQGSGLNFRFNWDETVSAAAPTTDLSLKSGFFSAQATSNTDMRTYRNGSQVALSTTNRSAIALPDIEIFLLDSNGFSVVASSFRMRFFAFTTGLTAAEELTHYNLVNTLVN